VGDACRDFFTIRDTISTLRRRDAASATVRPMLLNLALGLPTMAVCLVLQALILGATIRYYRRRKVAIAVYSFQTTVGVTIGVMMLLMAGNLAQIAAWALLFRLLREFDDFGAAFYHSAVNFATLGYGDVVMSARYKLLGPLEAINGALMVGVSTATLMVAFQGALQSEQTPAP
jgi:ion channel